MTGFQKIQKEIAEKYQPKKEDGLRISKLFYALDYKMKPSMSPELLKLKSKLEERNLSRLEIRDALGWRGFPAHAKQVRALRHAMRISGCGSYLEFSHGGESRSLDYAKFCHDRFCPCCNWRRSLKVYGQVQSVMKVLEPKKYNYLLLTLTQKNCGASDPTELKKECDAVYQGWRWLYRNGWMFQKTKKRDRIIRGVIRSFEVTYNSDNNTFHPHFHVILAVPCDYFDIYKDYYVTAAEWAEEWACALDLTYLPDVDICRLRPDGVAGQRTGAEVTYNKAVAEISKYATKITDVLRYNKSRGMSILEALTYALRGRRLLALTGCFRDAFQDLGLKDPEAADADLVDVENDDMSAEKDIDFAVFTWNRKKDDGYCLLENSLGDIKERLVETLSLGFLTPAGRKPLKEGARKRFESRLRMIQSAICRAGDIVSGAVQCQAVSSVVPLLL